MERKNRKSISENVTIDLVDFIWRILIRYRAIILFAIVIGIGLMFFTYARDVKNSETAVDQPTSEEALMASLTEDQLRMVRDAVRNHVVLNGYDRYIIDSPLLSVDPYNERTMTVTYAIGGTDSLTAATLREAYYMITVTPEYRQSVGELMPEDSNKEYAGELTFTGSAYRETKADESAATTAIRAYSDDNALLIFNVILLDGMDEDAVADCVINAVEARKSALSAAIGSHTLNLVSSEELIRSDMSLLDQQKVMIDQSMSALSYLNSEKSYFSENMTLLYNLLIAKEAESGTEFDSKLDMDAEYVTIVTPETPEVRLHPKYALLGAVVGAILYIFVYLVYILFLPRIKTAKECEEALSIRTLGEFRSYHEGGFGRIFLSKRLYEMQHKRYRDSALQKEKIVDSLLAVTKRTESTNVAFVAIAPLSDAARNSIEDMRALLREQSTDSFLLEGDINTDTKFHRSLAAATHMVLILTPERTAYADIDLTLGLCLESDIEVVGTVIADE